MNAILIAGATGTIGSELARQLRAADVGFDVLSGRPADDVGGTATRVARYEDVDALTAAFQGVETLFVVLPLVPHKRQLGANVAQAAQAAGVRHLVRASGAGADPASPFALPRLQGEVDAILAGSGAATTFLRNAGFMQNYATFLRGAVRDGHLAAATGDAPQSLVDVRDIAAVAATVLRDPAAHAGAAYTLTGGEALTDSQRAAILSAVIGRPVRFTALDADASEATMRDAWRLPAEMVAWMGSLDRLVAAGYAAGVSPDVARLLGREPIRFEAFARDHRAVWA